MSNTVPPLLPQTGEARLRELETLVEWQGDELSKRMACVNCGEEPHPDSELYSTVCPSCRMCFSCCEPMCPTCGDLDGTKQRAIDLRNENQRLIAEVERLRSAGSAKPETAGFMEIQNALVNAGIYVGFGYTSDGVLKAYPSPTVSAGSAQAPETPPSGRRWTEVLCQKCGGNGVVKIPGGISQCPRCDGRCYEPDAASSSDEQAEGQR